MRQQDDFDVESFWDGCKLRSFPARTQWVLLWEPYKTGEWGPICELLVFQYCVAYRCDLCVNCFVRVILVKGAS